MLVGIRARTIVAAAAAWWLVVAIVTTATDASRGGTGGWGVLVERLWAVSAWVPLTVGVFALAWRVPFRRARWRGALALHVAGAAAVIVLRAAWIYALDPWVHFYTEPPTFETVLVHSIENNLFVYWLFVGVAHAVVFAREAAQRREKAHVLEAALARAEVAALAAAMQPHFLFNTLGGIAELVHRDADLADRAIVRLSGMLRRLVDDRRQEVPLRDELAFTRDYLELEALRLGDRLVVRWDIEPGLDDVSVPRLSLQPLVENAIRHGLWPTGRAGVLAIGVHRAGGGVVISVDDDGAGLPASPAGLPGERGLAIVRQRLEHLYGVHGRLGIEPRAAGVRAELVVPLGGPPGVPPGVPLGSPA